MAAPHVVPLPFDAAHYGRRVGSLIVVDDALDPAPAIAAARAGGYEVLFVRLPEAAPARTWFEAAGHAPVDVLVTSTLTATAPPLPAPAAGVVVTVHVRLDDPATIDAVAAITAASITRSHLHADPRLPAAQTRALFAAWARNDVTGRGAGTFLVTVDGALVGYLAAIARDDTRAIDLVAVAPDAQGRGAGAALVGAFVAWARAQGGPATVGTQADNPARRLYARAGFVPTATDVTYHLWLDP